LRLGEGGDAFSWRRWPRVIAVIYQALGAGSVPDGDTLMCRMWPAWRASAFPAEAFNAYFSENHQPCLASLEKAKQKCTVCTNSLPPFHPGVHLTPGWGSRGAGLPAASLLRRHQPLRCPMLVFVSGWSNFPPMRASARLAFPQRQVWRL